MKKDDFIKKVAEKAGVSFSDARKVVDATIESVIEVSKDEQTFVMSGLGTFRIIHKNERTVYNPKTQKSDHVVPARNVVKFRAAKNFTDKVN